MLLNRRYECVVTSIVKTRTFCPRVAIGSVVALLGLTLGAAPVAAQASLTCDGHAATIVGTNGNDVIVGTRGNDVIVALGGDDVVRGGSGDDIICGGDGADTITGDRGHDVLYGERGKDTIEGSRGQDTIYGGNGADILAGGNGADEIFGNRGADFLNGNRGADVLRGGQHDDQIRGGLQEDTILGGDGVDACDGEIQNTCEGDGVTAPAPAAPTPAPTTTTPPPSSSLSSTVGCSQADFVAYYQPLIGQQSQSTVGEVRAELLNLINETRSFCGLNPLSVHTFAQNSAQGWNDVLRADKDAGVPGWFRHGTTFGDIFSVQNGLATVGENLGFSSATTDVTSIHLLLIESGGHLCNIINPEFDYVGIGADTFTGSFSNGGRGMIITEQFAGDFSPSTPNVATFIAEDDFGNSGNTNTWSCF